MCGHVGIAGKLEFKDEVLMKRLLVMDYFRGPDSTGFAAVRNKENEIVVVKRACNPIDLFDSRQFFTALSGTSSKMFLGHNRAATKGVVNNNNAHPFSHGDIIGAHNGTLTDKSWKALEQMLGYQTGTDSEAIIHCISQFGIEETIKEMQGAWALVWYDASVDCLYFLRNEERTFYLSHSPTFDKVMWCSDWPIMSAATKLQGQHEFPLYVDEENHAYFPTEVNRLYKYNLVELKNNKDTLIDAARQILIGKAKEVPVTTVVTPFRPRGTTPGATSTTTSTTTSTGYTGSLTGVTQKTKVINVTGSDAEPLGEWAGLGYFDDISKNGCSWCGGEVKATDVGVIVYDRDDTILCSHCSGIENHSRFYLTSADFETVKEYYHDEHHSA